MSGENGITKELVQKALQKCEDLDDGKTNLSPITDVLEMAEKECLTEREAQKILRRRSRIEAALAYALMTLVEHEKAQELWGEDYDHAVILRWIRDQEKSQDLHGFVGGILDDKRHEFEASQIAGEAVSRTLAYAVSHIDYESCRFREVPLSITETSALLLKLNPEALHETFSIFMKWAREETDKAKVLDQLWDENKSARAALRLIFAFFGGGRETDPKEIVWEGTLLPADEHLREEVIGILNTVLAKNPVDISILPTPMERENEKEGCHLKGSIMSMPGGGESTLGDGLQKAQAYFGREAAEYERLSDPAGARTLKTLSAWLGELRRARLHLSSPTHGRDGELLQSTREQCNRLQEENNKLKEKVQALGHVIADFQTDKEARQ